MKRVFRAVNAVVEPAVRRGFASPLVGLGLIVVETTGRRTGLARRVPLVAWRVGDSVFVTTVRRNSAWVRNLEDDPQATVWSAGHKRPSAATVRRLPAGAAVHLRRSRT